MQHELKKKIIQFIPDVDFVEMDFLEEIVEALDQNQADSFLLLYRSKRRKADNVLLLTLMGFVVLAGMQRFYLNQVLMGFIYLFTGGLCLIGTIVDLINHKDLTLEYNEKLAFNLMDEVQMF